MSLVLYTDVKINSFDSLDSILKKSHLLYSIIEKCGAKPTL